MSDFQFHAFVLGPMALIVVGCLFVLVTHEVGVARRRRRQ